MDDVEYKGFEIEILGIELADGSFCGRFVAHSSTPDGIRRTDTTEITYKTQEEAKNEALAMAKRLIDAS